MAHAGKEELEIFRDDWAGKLGHPGLDWPGVVAEFSDQIDGKTVAGVAEMLATDFSSTTAIEATVAKVTVMDMLQEFFSYKMSTCCGEWTPFVMHTLSLLRQCDMGVLLCPGTCQS